ncbi:MAG: phage tail protein [Bradyrhizobium sp.]|uniref:phage tail protein n=1 Tax=Bradyrhizobium sp. TaxID=376 RepID=UPI003BF00045
MTFWKWSKTAASNATADASINYAEGQAPSSLNDSGRAVMAAAAKYRDDISGAIATGGTSTAYTVSSNQVFDTLAHLDGAMIAFTPHTTNGATVTLNVDGTGAKPLRSAPSAELPAGVLIQGTPYVAVYNNSDQAFYLHGFFGNPYGIMIGASIDYWGATAPNSSFVLAYGQAISRTTYSTLFSLLGTTFGTGDGSTTFNIPDLRGRVVAGSDVMGGVAAGRLTDAVAGIDGLGDAGGSQSHALTLGQLPTGITVTGSISVAAPTGGNIPYSASSSFSTDSYGAGANNPLVRLGGGVVNNTTSLTGTANLTSNNTSGNAHNIVQPTIVANKLLRII